MRRYYILAIVLISIIVIAPTPTFAQNHNGDRPCLPNIYAPIQTDCIPLEVSEDPPPIEPDSQVGSVSLPSYTLDTELSYLPYYYGRVNKTSIPLYLSLDAAVAGEPVYRYIEPGFDFITYIDFAEVEGKKFYMIAPGVWMHADGVSRVYAPDFQGFGFYETPARPFGWALYPMQASPEPGIVYDEPERYDFWQYDPVEIYETTFVGGVEWFRVGPNQWLDGRQVSRVTPNTTAPDGVDNDRWIEVNLADQSLAVYEAGQLVFATVISTGLPGTWTQPGLFQIYLMKETETMSGSFTADRSDYYYLEDVPWTMYFDEARALHGTYWHNGFGVPRSRGCVNLSPGDAQWIFNWAQEGDWVYVWDPSGETPTDPALYGSGGA
ncbi:MAG: murein L,D-transpeptidase [Chloroflexi bacterium]|nr:MAG: murein L,D-transpeptidase [Chloroflexota bacterium]MBL1194939.1 murein L,D-transpeptidase [Chloroflexota bacterium]NOH12229.1 L,D-transpeptidase [Chloroflexota bacterium]